MPRSPSRASPIRAARARARRRRPSPWRRRAAFPAPIAPPATAARPRSLPARARRCSATTPGTARAILRTSTIADEIGRHAGERAVARLNPSRPKPGRYPVLFDPRVAPTLLGHFAGAISGSAVARKTSFLQDKLGEPVFAHRRRRSSTIRFACAACARARSTAKACGFARRSSSRDGMLDSWIAESASARQLGIEPTGHASRGVGGAPGAAPSNLYMAAGHAQPRRTARAHFRRPCWSSS